jgi:hypothetical protein
MKRWTELGTFEIPDAILINMFCSPSGHDDENFAKELVVIVAKD